VRLKLTFSTQPVMQLVVLRTVCQLLLFAICSSTV